MTRRNWIIGAVIWLAIITFGVAHGGLDSDDRPAKPDTARHSAAQTSDLLPTPAVLAPLTQPCASEDSTSCYWDATLRGDGGGHSFVVWDQRGTTCWVYDNLRTECDNTP